jgi:hypothetical protein
VGFASAALTIVGFASAALTLTILYEHVVEFTITRAHPVEEHGGAEHPRAQRERERVLGEGEAEELGEAFESPGFRHVVESEEVLDDVEGLGFRV